MRPLYRTCLALLLISLVSGVCGEATFTINWFSINNGATLSTNPAHSIHGTLGQAAAGAAQDNEFEIVAGFWSLFLPLPLPLTFDEFVQSAGLSGASATVDADPDGDGVPNVFEYALGLDPAVAEPDASMRLPSAAIITESVNERYLTFTFERKSDISGVDFRVEGTPNLVDWTTLAEILSGAPISVLNGAQLVSESGGATVTATVRDAVPVENADFRAMRLVIVKP